MQANNRQPWIQTHALTFRHGSVPVVDSVAIDLYPGKHYVVAGPNGAGKSTLLDLLARLKTPASGAIFLHNRPLASCRPMELARRLAFARQEYAMDFSFTVQEIVAMGRRPFIDRWGRLGEEDWRAVDAALGRVNMRDLRDRPVTALSGGEKRRTIIAKALAQTAPILLLDEPCAGLDIAHALSVMALARDMARAGNLVVTVSHDLSLAASCADNMIFLKNGALVAAGPVREVFTDSVLADVYGTEARVRHDDFTGGLTASFRPAVHSALDSGAACV